MKYTSKDIKVGMKFRDIRDSPSIEYTLDKIHNSGQRVKIIWTEDFVEDNIHENMNTLIEKINNNQIILVKEFKYEIYE